MEGIKEFVLNNSVHLLRNIPNIESIKIFDNRGFWLSEQAQLLYNEIRNEPHLYVVNTSDNSGWYIGKSFQKGGRWKRSNAYHLRDLSCNILQIFPNQGNQNHLHWIENWFDLKSLNQIESNCFKINQVKEIKICFIPFHFYSTNSFLELTKQEIKNINSNIETQLIRFYLKDGIDLLNIQHNN